LQPRMLRDGASPSGIPAPVPVAAEQIPLSRSTHWVTVIDSMVEVVHGEKGTARKIGEGANYTIAGKTGTAQVFGIGQEEEYKEEEVRKKLRDHALFIAFAPAEQPKLAISVLVENGGSGSRAAAPVARKVLDHYLQHDPGDGVDKPLLVTFSPHRPAWAEDGRKATRAQAVSRRLDSGG